MNGKTEFLLILILSIIIFKIQIMLNISSLYNKKKKEILMITLNIFKKNLECVSFQI